MRLDAVMLADYATAAEGKLFINGGGITRINVPALPFALPSLSIILRFHVDNRDLDLGPHTCELNFVTPSGIHLFPTEPIPIDMPPPELQPAGIVEGEERFVQTVLTMGGVPLFETGVHTITIKWDEEVIREFALPVVFVGPVDAAPLPNRAERRRQERAQR